MNKIKVYLDTSVIGGCFDKEFISDSTILIEEIKNGIRKGVVSDITDKEIQKAPLKVVNFYASFRDRLEVLIIKEEIEILAQLYIKEKIITQKYRNDCLHIAYATVYEIDVLASWNFKHIVNFDRIVKFNRVNLENGYKALSIYSPKEVIKQND